MQSSELMAVLELVRMHFNAPVTVTSSYRCEKHNAAVGGAKSSKHLLGIAADIKVKGFEPEMVYQYLDSVFPEHYGIGVYDTFTHVDVRALKARWDNRS
jgi:uncharacterized protein YcbK (DUF882 family)